MKKDQLSNLPRILLASFRHALLLTVCCCACYLQGFSQEKVSLSLNKNIKTVLKEIEKQTDYSFVYSDNSIDVSKVVSIKVDNEAVENVLTTLFEGTNIRYVVKGKQVVLSTGSEKPNEESSKPEAPTSSSAQRAETATPQQPKGLTVKGTVKSETGEPLTGATVVVKNTNQVVIANYDGEFTLSNVDPNAVLQASFIGFDPVEISINGRSMVDFVLDATSTTLDASVVIGYGKTSTRLNTSSVSSVTSKAIGNQSVTNPISAMQGQVTGLYITSSGGLAGSEQKVQLRGINSIPDAYSSINKNEPLFVVDGVPFVSESVSQLSGAGGKQSPLSLINPSDIERIDVLKDADATAIYGSRGANGVILITTKSGKAGKMKVDFNLHSGISHVARKLDMLSPSQFYEVREDAYRNDGATPNTTNAPDMLIWDKNKTTDWQEYLIGGTANLTEAQLSFSGGSEQTNFRLSGTYHYESTVFPGDFDYVKGAAQLNVNHRSKDNRFRLTASVNYSVDDNNSSPTDFTYYYNLAPNQPLYNSDGSPYWHNRSTLNPAAVLLQTYQSRSSNLIGNTNLSYAIINGLEAKVSLGYAKTDSDQTKLLPAASLNNSETEVSSYAQYGFGNVRSYIAEPQLNYSVGLWQGKLSVLLGATWQQTVTEGHSVQGDGYSSDVLLQDMKSASMLTSLGSIYRQYNYQSVFGRVNYAWQDKYIVNLTFRRDGSSRFGPNKRWGNFGAIGGAWIFTSEPFAAGILPVMSFGKLRVSYGITGNDKIGDYEYLDSWSSTSYPYDGISGLYPSRLANKNYSWEENKKFEVGLDLGFLQNRIHFTADYYLNRSSSALIYFSVAPQTGFSQFRANLPALVENTGWEFDVRGDVIQGNEFIWNSGLNLSIPRNKLLEYPDLENSSYADTYVIGQPIDIVKGYNFLGVDPSTGVAQFQDVDKNGSITEPEDFVILGTPTPKFYGGFSNTLTYKNLELSFLLLFTKKDGPSINYGYEAAYIGGSRNNTADIVNRWHSSGDVTSIPGASITSSSDIYKAFEKYRLSNAVWGDASYIKLKNLTLSYRLSSLAKKLKLDNLNVYFQAQNLFTITSYTGFDPESQGVRLPLLRSFSAGIRISL